MVRSMRLLSVHESRTGLTLAAWHRRNRNWFLTNHNEETPGWRVKGSNCDEYVFYMRTRLVSPTAVFVKATALALTKTYRTSLWWFL